MSILDNDLKETLFSRYSWNRASVMSESVDKFASKLNRLLHLAAAATAVSVIRIIIFITVFCIRSKMHCLEDFFQDNVVWGQIQARDLE